MPYIRCPGCALDTYSAAGHSTTDACPRCGAALSGVRWTTVDGVFVVRRHVLDPAPEPEARVPDPNRRALATPSSEPEAGAPAPPAAP